MDKIELLNIFEKISKSLEYRGEDPFKIKAYSNIPHILEGISWSEIEERAKKETLTEIGGIGKGIAGKIKEYVDTGKIKYYEELVKEIPDGVFELFSVSGLGGKKIRALYEKLGISSIGELEYACNENRLVLLDGFGAKTQEKILKSIEQLKKYRGLHLFSDAVFVAEEILKELHRISSVINVEIAGSIRRRKEIIKDVDLVVSVKNKEEFSNSLKGAIGSAMEFKNEYISFSTKYGVNIDIFPVKPEEFYKYLIFVTGSSKYIEEIEKIAKEKNIEIQKEMLNIRNEREFFEILGLPYMQPELREQGDEILEVKKMGGLSLIENEDIKGVLHIHTKYSDGANSIEEIAEFCKKNGFSYLGIADHSKNAHYAGGLKENDVLLQIERINEINKKLCDFIILKGIECDILSDGSLDYDGEFLKNFDFVIAAVHTKFNMSEEEMTERIIKGISNPAINILAHPTGRLLLGREGYKVNMEKILDACLKYNVACELNANPLRLDIDWRNIRIANRKGVKIAINPDAHNLHSIGDIKYGVGIARKGFAENEDVINTYNIEKIIDFFRSKK